MPRLPSGCLLAALCWLAACGTDAPAPVEEPVIEYTVVRGDTLFLIARAHGVTVDQLRAWNGIDGDRIEVGQLLRIHPGDEAPASPPPARRRSSGRATGSAPEGPRLAMPPEKPCLDPPKLEGTADEAMAASQGLSEAQVRAAMSGFVHHTLSCLEDVASYPTAALDLEIRVACTGRVAEVRVVDPGDWSPEAARCVGEVLRHAPFPAHDLPDGDSFRYPLRFTPG